MTELREVRLPVELCEAVEKKFAGKFENLEALLACVLNELAAGDAADSDRAEQRIVEERLRELGYL